MRDLLEPTSVRLTLDRARVDYDGVTALDDVSLTLPPGGVLALLGPSGCGKSTLLRAVAGLEPLVSGRVLADDQDLAGVPTHRRGFSLLFQDGQLFGHLTVARNVGYALRLRRRPAAEVAARVQELLVLVGLEGYADRLPSTLSGGERQRVALARALAVRPRLLLLDEPLSALDTGLRERLAVDLRDILRQAGTTALMVTHDHEEAFTVADRLAVMRAGRIVQEGPIEQVWAAPADRTTALFLGYARVLEGEPAARLLSLADGPGSVAAHGMGGDGRSGPVTGVALRRSALVVDDEGGLRARVVSARTTPGQVRLVVEAERIGILDAVAPLRSRLGADDRVVLRVDPTRIARLAGPV